MRDFYLELSKVQKPRQLEGAPLVEIDSRTEEIEGEGSGHGAEELKMERGSGTQCKVLDLMTPTQEDQLVKSNSSPFSFLLQGGNSWFLPEQNPAVPAVHSVMINGDWLKTTCSYLLLFLNLGLFQLQIGPINCFIWMRLFNFWFTFLLCRHHLLLFFFFFLPQSC